MMRRLAYLMSRSLIALPEVTSSKLQDAKTAMGTRRRYPPRAVRALLAMLGLIVLLATFLATPARAGGLYLNEHSTTSSSTSLSEKSSSPHYS
jgi:hypothetical protein